MNTVARVLFVFLFVMLGFRFIGKREFGQLAPFDLVMLMLIPEFFQQAMTGEDYSMTNAVIGVSTLLCLVFITSLLSYRFEALGKIISGTSTTLASHGYLKPLSLDRERVAPDEILDAMHRAGLERMEQVKWAVLYPDGTIAVVPWHGAALQAQTEGDKKPA
jgi:uncharacterized membrane protein YcaP (DUF421 family)